MADVNRKRDRANGRYANEDLEILCVCGHELGQHTAARVAGQQECLTGECACVSYKRERREVRP